MSENILVVTSDDGSRWVQEEDYENLLKRYEAICDASHSTGGNGPPGDEREALATLIEKRLRLYSVDAAGETNILDLLALNGEPTVKEAQERLQTWCAFVAHDIVAAGFCRAPPASGGEG